MSGGIQGDAPNLGIYEHRVFKEKDIWKYAVKLTVGPADARWELSAHGDILSEVMADIQEQRKLMLGHAAE